MGVYIKARATAPPIDPDAQAFLTASAITDATITSAVNQLVLDTKGYGIWSKMKAIYPFVGGTASTHKWNLKDPQDTNAAFRLVFYGGITHSSNGVQGNGINNYADSFLIPSVQYSVNDNVHLSVYSRSNITENKVEIGCFNGTNSALQILLANSGVVPTSTRTFLNDLADSKFSDSDSRGFYIASRTGTSVTMFENATLKTTLTTPSPITRPNVSIYVTAQNNAGGPNIPSSKQLAFATIGDALTNTEAANFYTAVNAFQVALSRNV